MNIKEKIKGIFTLKNYINLDVLKEEVIEEQKRQEEEQKNQEKKEKV
jgi:hypothetical protein